MSYFIHTLELSALLEKSDYDSLFNKLKYFPIKEGYEFRCTEYEKYGITIAFRVCTKNEKLNKKRAYGKLMIIYNPSRGIVSGSYYNEIHYVDDFIRSIQILDVHISNIFGQWSDIDGIDDLELSRVDITKDIHGIPENIIQEFITICRRLPLCRGYSLNTQLEENCKNFRKQDSINILSKSRGIEFVLYNKHQSTIDMKYPVEVQQKYRDTLRMELRCSRKFVREFLNDISKPKKPEHIYLNMGIVSIIAQSIFRYDYNSCFTTKDWIEKIVEKKIGGKDKKSKMNHIAGCLDRKPDSTLDEMLNMAFKKYTRKTVLKTFERISLSPIPIISSDIPFIQSIGSLLEFCDVNPTEQKYYNKLANKVRNKEVFIHQ